MAKYPSTSVPGVWVYLHGPAPWKTAPRAAFRGRQELDLPEIYTPVRSNPGETPVGHQATCTKHTHRGGKGKRKQTNPRAVPTPGRLPPPATHTHTCVQGTHIICSGGAPVPPLTTLRLWLKALRAFFPVAPPKRNTYRTSTPLTHQLIDV